MENEYTATSQVNQIQEKLGFHLHLHLTFFTPHLFNIPLLESILQRTTGNSISCEQMAPVDFVTVCMKGK